MGNKHLADGHMSAHSVLSLKSEMDRDSTAFSMGKIHIFEELLLEKSSEGSRFCTPLTKAHNDISGCLLANGTQPIVNLPNKNCFLKMTEVAEKLGGPLPFYHPDTLLMNVYSGNWKRAYVAVCHLVESLASNCMVEQTLTSAKSSFTIRQIKLSKYFEGQLSNEGASQGFQWNKDLDTNTYSSHSGRGLMQFADISANDAINSVFSASGTSSELCGFHEMMEKLHVLEIVTYSQKMQIFAIVDLLREISNSQSASAYESLDEPGRRFWCAIKLQQLDFCRRYSRVPSMEELVVESRLIGWAFHSDCQAVLFNIILPAEPTWEDMRKLGVGFWFTNLTDLRTKMEKLARCQYLKKKDPKACALLYIALNRLQVLAGLFKISKDEKDKPLVAFLSRNFQEEKHRAAALKNAYVLMGRHQYELAIAFFLLGGDITSAISVCAKTLGDDQLALVICRLVEGQGGASEHFLISKILLPSAIEKSDYWLASVLEWVMGNYLQSFMIVLHLQGDSYVAESERSFKHAVFLNPSIGQYCQMLAAKNSLRNAVGEQNTAILCRWATVLTASAFNKCGLPLEALECLSSSASILGGLDKRPDSKDSGILPRILQPSPSTSSRWLSHEVACQLEYQVKLDLAVRYAIQLIREHPCWLNTSLVSTETGASSLEREMIEYRSLLENFERNWDSELAYLEQKFSVARDVLFNKIFVSLDNDRLLLTGYHLLHGIASQDHLPALSHTVGNLSQLLKHFVDVAEYLSYSLSRFAIASSIASSPMMASSEQSLSVMRPYCWFQFLEFYVQGFMLSIGSQKVALMTICSSSVQDLIEQSMVVLDLWKYCIYFSSAILQRNVKALAAILQPVLVSCTDGNYGEFDMMNLRAILGQAVKALSPESQGPNDLLATQRLDQENEGDKMFMMPEDEKWTILGVCLWQQLSKFLKFQLNQLSNKLSCDSVANTSSLTPTISPKPDDNCSLTYVRQVLMNFMEAIDNTFMHISSHIARHLAAFFWQKVEGWSPIPTLRWLEEFNQPKPSVIPQHQDGSSSSSEVLNKENSFPCSELLTNICDDPKAFSQMLAQLPIKLSELIHWKAGKRWNHLHMCVLGEHERLESYKQEGVFDSSPHGNENERHSAGSEQSHYLLDSDKGTALTGKVVSFNNPKEIYRRHGELLEALCVNSIEQQQAALASNKKGISFFDWGDRLPCRDPSDYIWALADWPQNGWADTRSTPVPPCVSPGVGLGSEKHTQPRLGGATVGVGSQARLGRDLTAGRSFGVAGYAGTGADFNIFVDPPTTLNNVNASALAAHPSRPFFLVGSSNTHVYLWEFGEEKAVATYRVLAAADVPPPYALASVTALQFDRCGHRFANSASDGTVCTWQLGVGGRSNVRPTESSLCFNGHASDVCYVATSGSIIAAAGYSSNSVNVVIWDTLAPPASSRASVMCHEGGASSIAVFDNDVGTGSISPLIVTGGKGGDIGLHDFRYIATGKTKRHRYSNNFERFTDTAAIDIQSELSSSVGDQNRHGMLWYIPKAHSGSITKISTIPNTSFFLTGSKDGDVKLWDARRACLVFHWPKMHERHTFLQRSSQGFGGVTRVGVTDIQVLSDGFLTCGGDGSVKLVELNNFTL